MGDRYKTAKHRRTLLKYVGLGAVGVPTVASTDSVSADVVDSGTDQSGLSLDLAIGDKELLGDFDEVDDYHDIENQMLSGFDVQLEITGGGGSALLCHTAALRGNSLDGDTATSVQDADDPHTEYHGFLSGGMSGSYTLVGVATDATNRSTATATVDFTVQ